MGLQYVNVSTGIPVEIRALLHSEPAPGSLKAENREFPFTKGQPWNIAPCPSQQTPFWDPQAEANFLNLPSASSHYCFTSSDGGNSLFPKAELFPTSSHCFSVRSLPGELLLNTSVLSDVCQLNGGPSPTARFMDFQLHPGNQQRLTCWFYWSERPAGQSFKWLLFSPSTYYKLPPQFSLSAHLPK